jgi:golgi SNAP receptor complex member 1
MAQRNPADSLSIVEQGVDHPREFEKVSKSLKDIIRKMEAAATTPSQRAVSQRYENISSDLQRDFQSSLTAWRRAWDRHELLHTNSAPLSGDATGMDSLLRERNHINNSVNAASSTLSQAESIREDLHWQGRSLRNTGGLMGQIASNVPGMNRLIDAIRSRRLRDDQIVAGVIATCIVFTLWYMFG